MHAPLGLNKSMEFIDDDGPDLAEIGGKFFFLEENFERLGGYHQEMGGFSILPGTVSLCYITMPFHNRERCGYAECPETFFLIVDQRLQWGDVKAGNPVPSVFKDIIHYRNECCLGFPPGSWRNDEHVVPF